MIGGLIPPFRSVCPFCPRGGPRAQIALPLHQRVQLLKASSKGKLTTNEALKQIMAETGRPPLKDAWGDSDVRFLDPADDKVGERSVCRYPPPLFGGSGARTLLVIEPDPNIASNSLRTRLRFL